MKKNVVMFVVLLAAVQAFACAAITKKGTLCKRTPVPGSLYCWQHGGRAASRQSSDAAPSTPSWPSIGLSQDRTPTQNLIQQPHRQCEAVYRDGPRCNGFADVDSKFCLLHKDYDPENPPILKVDRLPQTDQEFVNKTHELMLKIEEAIAEYKQRNPKKLPSSLKTLRALLPTGTSVPLKDAWGSSFVYEAEGLDYIVVSPGKDCKLGTPDDMKISSLDGTQANKD